MPDLSPVQFQTVYNFLSLAVAGMFGSFVFFAVGKSTIEKKYQLPVVISSVIVFIAGYHYFRIFQSWDAAYMLSGGVFTETGKGFNDAYRYADWILTVPLLLAELVLSLGVASKKRNSMLTKYLVAAFLMIALGYPGEVATDQGSQILWFVLSCIPFVYILVSLFTSLSQEIASQPESTRGLFIGARNLLLVVWLFYPIAYLFNMMGETAVAEVGVQVGYTLADVIAKAVYGVFIFAIAYRKSHPESA